MLFNPETHVSKHFSIDELACKGSGELILHEGFIELLEDFRVRLDRPITPNSCCRAPWYNEQINGHPRSLHQTQNGHWGCNTMAIDVACTDVAFRHEIISVAAPLGWSIGVAKSFVHLDARKQLLDMSPASWGY
ncbi:MAG: D-Ala-D-Ala carboxypeptidase family metallohydrolase [Pseudomonadota bacterium]